jgi:hypothetical protein
MDGVGAILIGFGAKRKEFPIPFLMFAGVCQLAHSENMNAGRMKGKYIGSK